MQVMILKMHSGEELIANLSGNTYSKIRVFHVAEDMNGNARAGLMPWILSAPDASLEINENHISAQFEAPAEIERAYLEATTSIALVK